MGRTKGSKNKKTLLRLAQEKVEQQLKELDKKTSTTSIQDIQEDADTKIEQKTHFVQKSQEMNTHAQVGNESEYLAKLSNKQLDKLKTCKKCGATIISDSYRIDTNILTAISSQHREHPRYIELCRNCAKELSDVVDNWLGKEYPTKWEDNEGGY